jgi:A/G-specific adenine glycosylase
MMILRHGDSVLLERRPPTGIWGGLSSLPEAPPDADVGRVCRERFGVQTARLQRLDPIRHGFTHFRLMIHPVVVEVTAIDPHAAEAAVEWLPLDAALGAALPAPVKKLLAPFCLLTPSASTARVL